MKTNKNCKHCNQLFESRRSNHVYCTTSCKTKASYKRNNYRYVPGHYEKSEETNTDKLALPANQDVLSAVQALEDKIERFIQDKSINTNSIKEAALGSIAADAGAYAAKRIFAPKTLPATKGDIVSLREELQQLKNALNIYKISKFPTNF
ncbi:hypothetical protein [Winogradskyella schleiferi]|uniref:hypothetical protein n=1 Tax=Winogradskyella schleiferi TaxID=2686078 RepID=UPI0015BE3AE8|nr:hypothetical protein [Winogradskyella schleiferi]